MSGKKIAEFLGWSILAILYSLLLMGTMILMLEGGGIKTTLIPGFNSFGSMPLD